MTAPTDRSLQDLLEFGDRIVAMATKGGATVAECVVRSGAELSAKVRMGQPELVEEAGHRAAGLRVMKGKQVASTSTSDLSEAGIDRFVKDALELVELSQEDPFAGPADPKLLADPSTAPDLELYDPKGGTVNAAQAVALAKEGEDAAFAFDKRITNSDGATFGRTASAAAVVLSSGFRAAYKGSYQSLSVVPVAADEGGKNRRGYHWTAKRWFDELEKANDVGREAARRTLRKLGARRVRSRRRALDPRHARRVHHGELDLAKIELPRRPRRDARRERSRRRRRRSAHQARARIPAVRRRRAREPQERRRREGNPPHVPLRQLLGSHARARIDGQRVARRRGRRRREHEQLHLATGHRLERSDRQSDEARALRHRDDGLRLQRRDRRLLARRFRLLDRER
jgi:PmbA/TldA metallopeptidase central domain/PmbA/TldA metallopeptidase domain 1